MKEKMLIVPIWIAAIAFVAMAWGCLKDGGNMRGEIQEIREDTQRWVDYIHYSSKVR